MQRDEYSNRDASPELEFLLSHENILLSVHITISMMTIKIHEKYGVIIFIILSQIKTAN